MYAEFSKIEVAQFSMVEERGEGLKKFVERFLKKA